MSSNESAAYDIMTELDVDYVLVIFGGVIGYSGDDINKFLWMVGDVNVMFSKNATLAYSVSPHLLRMIFRCASQRASTHRTSRSRTTSLRGGSSGWTAREAPPCSTASCTNSPTTGTDREQLSNLKKRLLCNIKFFRFGELKMDYRSPAGYDRTRNAVIGHKVFEKSLSSKQCLK